MEPNPQAKIDLLLLQEQLHKEGQTARNRTLEISYAVGATLLFGLCIWVRSGALWAALTVASAIVPLFMIRSIKTRTKITGWVLLLSTLLGGVITKPDSLINPGQIKQLQQQTQQLQTDQ